MRAIFPAHHLKLFCCALPLFALVASQAAANCEAPQTTVEMRLCAEQDFEVADAELNAAYKVARQHMRRLDQDLPDHLKGAADALLQAQRAWIPFRDAACAAEGFEFRGGSFEPVMVRTCKTALTQRRSEDLRLMAVSN